MVAHGVSMDPAYYDRTEDAKTHWGTCDECGARDVEVGPRDGHEGDICSGCEQELEPE